MLDWIFDADLAHPPRAVKRQRDGRVSRRGGAHSRAVAEVLERRLLFTRFAIIGDMGESAALLQLRDMIVSWNPEFITSVGDVNNQNDTDFDETAGKAFHDWISPYVGNYGAGSPGGVNRFWPTFGNHDWGVGGFQPWLDYFTLPGNERYYKVSLGNIEFFFVNSDEHEPDGNFPGSTQYNWLQSNLTASTAQWQLVFTHHPPYASGGQLSWENMQWPYQQWGADAVISGHSHVYERIIRNGFPYFINGVGGWNFSQFFDPPVSGSQFRYNSDYGAMLVESTATSINFKFYKRTGELLDEQTIGTATPSTPTAPSALATLPISSSQIRLNWTDNSSNETGFRVERSTEGTNFSEIATTAAGVATYTDSGRTPGVTYSYRVRAYNGTGNSLYSNTASAAISTSTIIAPGASGWKYLANGSNQGTTWRSLSFNDASWSSGTAELGYGDGGEATVVPFGPNASNKFITTYFRKSFNIASPSSIGSLDLRVIRDDGAVVYLNGTEVFRSNMPGGTIGYTTRASTALGTPAESTWIMATINAGLLQSGNNVIAIEIHQSDPDSSDLSFNLELNALTSGPPVLPPGAPSALSASALAWNQVKLSWIDTVTTESGFKIERSTDGTNFTEIAVIAANLTTWTDTTVAGSSQYWYRIRAYNAGGNSGYSGPRAVTTPPAPALPAPWSGADVGSVGIAGTSLHNAGTFTLEGSGVDIWGTADGFRYVYQALSGDGEIVARVTGIENTNSGANAGVMIRESLSAGAPHASTMLTAASGIGFVRRAGASASSSVSTATGAMPYWVRVVRSGNSFTSFRSSNGTTWTQVGSAVTITM
ncbi:MAG: metallophosphoesterase, partial [Tepidisphaeraceae bacterium]